MRTLLLNPGPVSLSERVRKALAGPDLCHREPEFAELQNSIRERLLKVYGLDPKRYAAVLLTGSGTAAMEAMMASLVPEDGKLLVIENGVYGERLSKIAEIHGIPLVAIKFNWGEQIDTQRLKLMLDEHEGVSCLAVVHHETATGRLNDLALIARLCTDRGIRLLVDGVSSFGAEDLHFDEWNLAAVAATGNKCLHGVPGACFVIVRRDALPGEKDAKRTLYLDLSTYCREQDRGGTPYTQSVQCFYALAEALAEFEEQGGWRARHSRYAALAKQTREGLIKLGIKPLLSDGASSVVLNAYLLPKGVTYQKLHDHLRRHSFVIYSGQGQLAQSIFRISTMGEITAADIDTLLKVFPGSSI